MQLACLCSESKEQKADFLHGPQVLAKNNLGNVDRPPSLVVNFRFIYLCH